MEKGTGVAAREAQIMLRYMIGENVESIAANEKVSTKTIYKILKQHHVPLKSEKEVTTYFRQKIFHAMIKEKKPAVQIAEELGLPYALINGYVRYEYARVSREAEQKTVTSKQLSKGGLAGNLSAPNRTGLVVSQTDAELAAHAALAAVDEVPAGVFFKGFDEDLTDVEQVKLRLLKELLRYAATVSELADYSEDELLLPDYLLPIDVIIMKDMTARTVRGEAVTAIAQVHRTDVQLVIDLVTGGLARGAFRTRYIKSLVASGFIQL